MLYEEILASDNFNDILQDFPMAGPVCSAEMASQTLQQCSGLLRAQPQSSNHNNYSSSSSDASATSDRSTSQSQIVGSGSLYIDESSISQRLQVSESTERNVKHEVCGKFGIINCMSAAQTESAGENVTAATSIVTTQGAAQGELICTNPVTTLRTLEERCVPEIK